MALGAGAFYGANLILGRVLTPESFGHFAVHLSALALAYSFGLLGVEQVLLRHGKPEANGIQIPHSLRIAESFAWPVSMVLLSAFFTWKYPTGGMPFWADFVAYALITSSTALLLKEVSYQRLAKQFDLAQWGAQGWRIILLAVAGLVWLFDLGKPEQLIFLLAASVIASLLLSKSISHFKLPDLLPQHGGIEGRPMMTEAFLFSSSLVSISLLAQMDRLMIAKSLSFEEAGSYVFLLALSMGPFALIQSYMGFTLLPKLRHRSKEESHSTLLRTAYLETMILGLVATIAVLALYFLLVRRHYNSFYHDPGLVVTFLALGWIKAFYGVASARLSAIAKLRHLASATVWGWGITLAALPCAWFLGGGRKIDMAVVVGLFWLMRTMAWLRLARKTEKEAAA